MPRRPGQQQGQHRGGVQTPRLSSPKAQQGASVGIDGSAMLDHNCSRGLRTWLSAAGRPGRGLAGGSLLMQLMPLMQVLPLFTNPLHVCKFFMSAATADPAFVCLPVVHGLML